MDRFLAKDPPPHRDLCTDCGVSRTAQPKRCATACQFIAPDYPAMERQVHGRARRPHQADEQFFGPYQILNRAALKTPAPGAQWTGITTRIAQRLLEEKMVDAVLTMAPDEEDRWRPVPVLITDPQDMERCRGMRMGYAPLLALLEPALQKGIERIAVIGIPCQVYALRALEKELGFKKIYVIGTPCSDNTTTERFHEFLALLEPRLYHPDGQQLDEVYVYGSFLQSKMYAKGVTCSDCHDPHTQRLRATGNALCAQCHAPKIGRAHV